MARLTQIIDKSQILSLQKRLTHALGMSVVFEEPNGGLLNVVGHRGGVCKACTDFIDLDETGRKKCLTSDSRAASEAQDKLLRYPSSAGVVVEFYECHGQFRNFVIPISIGGEVIGNVFSGQFLVQTLTSSDSEFDSILARMQQLGVNRDNALRYASMPDEDDIFEIAKDSNIPQKQWPAFKTAYKEMLRNAKPLGHVIDAVYLLNEIAQTLSALGNAYYYNDTCTKLTAVFPDQLRPLLADELEEVSGLVQRIKARPLVDLSTEVTEANQLIHQILSKMETHESEYIRALLMPYDGGVIPATPPISALQKSLVIARLIYETTDLRTMLNKVLRLKIVSPGIYNSDDTKLFDEFDSKLQVVESVLSDEPAAILQDREVEETTVMLEAIAGIRDKLVERQPRLLEERVGLDNIENLLVLLSDADFGLQTIRDRLCDERVLDHLPAKLAELRQKSRLGYDVVCLNWGGISSSLSSVVRESTSWSAAVDRYGPVSSFSEKMLDSGIPSENVLSSVRETVASLIACGPDQVVLTHNTTHGVVLALSSIDFSQKEHGGRSSPDRILLTDCEHDTVFHCIEQIERKSNVRHETLNVLGTPSVADMINDIVSRSSDGKTKVVIMSQVTYNTGRVLAVADVIRGVSDTLADKTPLFLIDGAQAVGHVPVDVSALNCDFYAADAHKWLMGPRGCGFLYVKESYLEERSDCFDFYEGYLVADRYRPYNKTRDRTYEPATISVETYVGMRTAIEAVLGINGASLETYNRIVVLSRQFRQLVTEELGSYGAQLVNQENESGLVTVRFLGHDDFALYDHINRQLDNQFHILARALDYPPCLRFSISYLNSEWEIDFAVRALERILQEIPELAAARTQTDEKQALLEARRSVAQQTIRNVFTEAIDALSARQEEAKRKFIDIKRLTKSRQAYEESMAQLKSQMQTLLCRSQSASEDELEDMPRAAEKEIDRILYGKKD